MKRFRVAAFTLARESAAFFAEVAVISAIVVSISSKLPF
jgi:hypothetical protein